MITMLCHKSADQGVTWKHFLNILRLYRYMTVNLKEEFMIFLVPPFFWL